jgi:hypothetical protein
MCYFIGKGVGGDRSPESVELANRVVWCCGMWTGDSSCLIKMAPALIPQSGEVGRE